MRFQPFRRSPPTQGRDTRLRISLVEVRILSVARTDPFTHTTVPWRDTILRRSMVEVRILSVVLLASPSGTALVSKSGEQCSIHWRRALSGSRSGPPCGVTAAGGISGLETRRIFSYVWPSSEGTRFGTEGTLVQLQPRRPRHLGVAQEQSASFGTMRPLVRFQSPRPQFPPLAQEQSPWPITERWRCKSFRAD